MAGFYGRAEQVQALDKRWRSRQSEFVVIYGRRRVGKSELIRRFSKGKRTLYHVGSRSDRRSQMGHFLTGMADVAQEPLIGDLPYRDWDAVFGRLSDVMERAGGKTLIVMDEFQWMAESSPELPSIIQKWWDSRWSRSGKAFLILCGSLLGFMEREVLGNKSPLFGRKTAHIFLPPLTFSESRPFARGCTIREQMKRYCICGGIPAYHKLFTGASSLGEELCSQFFELDAPLSKEADFLLVEELRDPKLYFGLLENLGGSRKTVTELAQAVGIERSRMPYYTKNLMELRFITKDAPLLRYADASERKARYRISDPLLRFWFSFVYPNQNSILRTDPNDFYSGHVAPRLDSFFGYAFEPIAADLFARAVVAPRTMEPWKLGCFWDKTIQLDFTIALKSGFSYLGEAKWGAITPASAREYSEKLKRFDGVLSYRPVMVSVDPVSREVKKSGSIDAYSLIDLLK
jgi:AAA+ ATPase superfamily predicted ATPase